MRMPWLAGLVVICGQPLMAQQLDLSFNDDAVRGVYTVELRRDVRADAGWLHDKDAGDVLHAGLVVGGEASSGPQSIQAGLGGRLFYLDGEKRNQEGYGLAVGGTLRVIVPEIDRIVIGAALYYAPDVLVGSDAEEYIDLSVRAAYRVTRNAEAYLGARYVRADFERGRDARFDTGFHIGLDLRF